MSPTQRYGFTGREHDGESGLIYFRARTYDPTSGQFLQRDPIGFAAGDLNIYSYVENDPYNWSDPSGLVATQEYSNLSARSGFLGGLFKAVLGLANLVSLAMQMDNSGDGSGSGSGAGTGSGAGEGTGAGAGDPGCEPGDPDCGCSSGGSDDFGDVNFDGLRSDGDLGTIPFKTMSAETALRLVENLDTSIANRIADQLLHEQRYGRDSVWDDHQNRINREKNARSKASDKSKGGKC